MSLPVGSDSGVLMIGDVDWHALSQLLARYRLSCERVPLESAILGSFWGDSEAGLVANRLILRADTPVHSALHEAGHFVCMTGARRNVLHTDAGGDYDEENAVCYLQILLAGFLPGVGSLRLMQDMDRWGYSFRLGSARAWFEDDADDARAWLFERGLIDQSDRPTWKLRQANDRTQ
ncbi:MAG: hypothetical protein RQ736_05505 [Thiogranum sp.]|nr:hypothetical protein [Thiogranum sp.]